MEISLAVNDCEAKDRTLHNPIDDFEGQSNTTHQEGGLPGKEGGSMYIGENGD